MLLQLASNQLAASSALLLAKLEASQPCATSRLSSALDCASRMHSREAKCQPKDSQRTTEFAVNYSKLLLFTAAKNAMKVLAFVLDAYMCHWHFRACNYLTHICVIGN